MEIISSGYFTLFLIIALGFILGNIKIHGISLDISAIIFVALIFGHFGFIVPEDFQYIGLLLFIFTIGIQAGPGFFQSFKKKSIHILLIPLVLIIAGSITTTIIAFIYKIDFKIAVGLFAGAFTSTPGLAAAIDTTQSPVASIGYGIGYPFGVLGVILFIRIIPRLLKINFSKAEEEIKKETLTTYPEILSRHFIVENTNIFSKSIAVLKIRSITGASISRIKHGDIVTSPTSETILNRGDIIKAIGTDEALERVKLLIGNETNQEIPLGKDFEMQYILVTNKKIVNKTLGQLYLQSNYNAIVTRIRRSGINITPTSSSVIKFGDKLMVVCSRDHIKDVVRLLGNNDKRLSDTNFFPVAAGIVLGVLAGKININFSDNFSFSPGLTGGVLIISLLLGYIGKTGPIIWTMSGTANHLLRQLGLLFFLASVGTSAGANLVETYNAYGIKLFSAGMIITMLPLIIGTVFAYYIIKINPLRLFGALAGGMTSTPGLAAIEPMTETNTPQIAYATVYPVAMVLMIICIQILSIL